MLQAFFLLRCKHFISGLGKMQVNVKFLAFYLKTEKNQTGLSGMGEKRRLAKVLNKSSDSQVQHQAFHREREYNGGACEPRLRAAVRKFVSSTTWLLDFGFIAEKWVTSMVLAARFWYHSGSCRETKRPSISLATAWGLCVLITSVLWSEFIPVETSLT